jgi:hypothetical protein
MFAWHHQIADAAPHWGPTVGEEKKLSGSDGTICIRTNQVSDPSTDTNMSNFPY